MSTFRIWLELLQVIQRRRRMNPRKPEKVVISVTMVTEKVKAVQLRTKIVLIVGKKVISRTQRHVLRKRRLKKKPLVD